MKKYLRRQRCAGNQSGQPA